jgi:hypothetical protein
VKHALTQDGVTRHPTVFPLADLGLQWGDPGDTPRQHADAGRDILKILMSGNGQPAGSQRGSHVPGFMRREGWDDVASDEALARFMFAGMGINNVKVSAITRTSHFRAQ